MRDLIEKEIMQRLQTAELGYKIHTSFFDARQLWRDDSDWRDVMKQFPALWIASITPTADGVVWLTKNWRVQATVSIFGADMNTITEAPTRHGRSHVKTSTARRTDDTDTRGPAVAPPRLVSPESQKSRPGTYRLADDMVRLLGRWKPPSATSSLMPLGGDNHIARKIGGSYVSVIEVRFGLDYALLPYAESEPLTRIDRIEASSPTARVTYALDLAETPSS